MRMAAKMPVVHRPIVRNDKLKGGFQIIAGIRKYEGESVHDRGHQQDGRLSQNREHAGCDIARRAFRACVGVRRPLVLSCSQGVVRGRLHGLSALIPAAPEDRTGSARLYGRLAGRRPG